MKQYKAWNLFPEEKVYLRSDVDEAIAELKDGRELDAKTIAELKARIADLEKLNHNLCERVTENDEIRLHWEEIEQTRAEIESLKAKLESVQASAYADSVDAGMRERRLKRALYKACANWAFAREVIAANFIDVEDSKKWAAVEAKCSKKAEEYR